MENETIKNESDLENDPEIIPGEGLNDKQELFCRAYADPDGESWHNASKAALDAGYSPNSRAAPSRLMANKKIRQRIIELTRQHEEKVCLSPSVILLDLERLRSKAEAKGDLNAAIRAVELLGKTMSLFSDRSIIQTPEQAERLSEKEMIEGRRIASLLLNEKKVG